MPDASVAGIQSSLTLAICASIWLVEILQLSSIAKETMVLLLFTVEIAPTVMPMDELFIIH
jgi:hypothetical protein